MISRCTTPWWWAYASPRAVCRTHARAWFTGAPTDLPPQDYEADRVWQGGEYWFDKHAATGDREALARAAADAWLAFLMLCPRQLAWVQNPTQTCHAEQQHYLPYSNYYASPEQLLAVGRLDRRSDVYSLGATLWELLTLRPLFDATEEMPTPELMLRIQSAEPDRVRKHQPTIPRDIAYRRCCGRKEPRDKLGQVFDTFEVTLKYLVYLGLSDLCHCRLRRQPVQPLPKHQGFDLTRRPVQMTMGQWVRSLQDCAAALAQEPDRIVRELPDVCCEDGWLDREVFRWINTNRNAVAHRKGGISLRAEECPPLLAETRPKLEKLFQEIAFLRRYPLGFVTPGFRSDRSELLRYRVHSCMGARVAFGDEVYPMETKIHLPEHVLFVVSPDEPAILCLWPFLLERESDATQRPSLDIFEQIDPERQFLTKVHAAAIDHTDMWRVELHGQTADNHDWLWERLGKLPQVVQIAPELRLAEGLAEPLVGRLTGECLGRATQYKLLRAVARGGFGTIYDAIDTRTRARVAVKVLEDREGLDAEADRPQFHRFKQEYEKLSCAGHEFGAIVRCFEWDVTIVGRREDPWYSMEFAAGGDLRDRLAERRDRLQDRLPWEDPEVREQVLAEFRTIAQAVAHLHDLNIIHRDVKPANVLIMEGGELRLSDFGLIKDLDRPRVSVSVGAVSSLGARLGTRDYMAPEQEHGREVTKSTDVFAIGILLAELLTGRRPQRTEVASGSPFDRDERLARLPEPLRDLVIACTDLDPTQRGPDACYLVHQFERAIKKATQ